MNNMIYFIVHLGSVSQNEVIGHMMEFFPEFLVFFCYFMYLKTVCMVLSLSGYIFRVSIILPTS